MATIYGIRCTGKLDFPWLILNGVQVPFISGTNLIRRVMNKETCVHWNCPNCFLISTFPAMSVIRLLLRAIMMLLVKLVSQMSTAIKLLHLFLAHGYVTVPGPLDDVMQLPIAPCSVENGVKFQRFCCVDSHYMWFCEMLPYDRWCVITKLQYMENAAVPHCIWKVQFVTILIDDHAYHIWSHAVVFNLLWRPRWSHIPGWQWYFASNSKSNFFPGGVLWVSHLYLNYMFPENQMSLFQAYHPPICLHLWSETEVLG